MSMVSFWNGICADVYIFKVKMFRLGVWVGVICSLSFRLFLIFRSFSMAEVMSVLIYLLPELCFLALVHLPRTPPTWVDNPFSPLHLVRIYTILQKIISFPGPCRGLCRLLFIFVLIQVRGSGGMDWPVFVLCWWGWLVDSTWLPRFYYDVYHNPYLGIFTQPFQVTCRTLQYCLDSLWPSQMHEWSPVYASHAEARTQQYQFFWKSLRIPK